MSIFKQNAPKIRVILAVYSNDKAYTLSKWLTADKHITIVGSTHYASDIPRLVMDKQADVVLMEPYLEDLRDMSDAGPLIARTPARTILLVTEDDHVSPDEAMSMGARGVLFEPLDMNELLDRMHAVASLPLPYGSGPVPVAMQRQPEKTKKQQIIAVAGVKGGVGASVVSVNLAMALKEMGNDVVLLDYHFDGADDYVMLNLPSNPSFDQLRNSHELNYELINECAATHPSGLRFIRPPEQPREAEPFAPDAMRAALIEVQEHFDYVVIDMPVNYDPTMFAILDEAAVVLLIMTLDLSAINRMKMLLMEIEHENIAPEKVWLVGNKVNTSYEVKPNRLENLIKRRFQAILPNEEQLVIHSVDHGVPFVLGNRRAAITKSVIGLAKQIQSAVVSTRERR